MPQERYSLANREVIDIVVKRHDVETLIRGFLPNVAGCYPDSVLQAPFLNVLTGHISDIRLQL